MTAGQFFKDIGHYLKVAFTNPTALTFEAGIADIVLPGFATLINSAKTAIVTAEGMAAAAGVQNGTGTQKMAYAISLFQSQYTAWAAQNNLSQEPTAVQAFLQDVFNLLNNLQAAQTTATTPAVQTAPVAAQASTGTLL